MEAATCTKAEVRILYRRAICNKQVNPFILVEEKGKECILLLQLYKTLPLLLAKQPENGKLSSEPLFRLPDPADAYLFSSYLSSS